jgi:Synergist-CTERM protein sorting domain-containing protein
VFADDATYQLDVDTKKLSVPVGEKLSSNINLFVTPKYERDMIPRDFRISGEGVTRDEEGIWHWNGLAIEGFVNTATWNSWLEVSGTAEQEGSVELMYAPARGDNMTSSASFTIEAHKEENIPETPETGTEPITNPDTPVVVTSDDVRIENPVAGETSKIVYIISDDVDIINNYNINNYINIQTVNLQSPDGDTIPLSNLNDNTVADPYTGGPNTYYFDRVNKQIIVYVTPEKVGNYVCNIYFEGQDPTKLNVHPVDFTVTKTKNYYTTEEKGGGCDVGLPMLALLFAAIPFVRKRHGK